MINKDSIEYILISLCNEIRRKDYNAEKNISSISMGIEDHYQWKSESNIYRGYDEIDRWNGIKIKVCPNRKRLIKFNFRLTMVGQILRKQDKNIKEYIRDLVKKYKNEN